MVASAIDYRPLLFSERVEPNDLGKFDLCRAASLAMGIDAATLGEWTTNANGSKWGKAKIKRALEKMRAATGEEGRGSYNQGHMDDFLRGVNFPVEAYERFNKPMSEIKQTLKTHVVFLAGDVRHTPAASPLRKYVNPNVGHEIILTGISNDGTKIAFIDPMTPHGTKRYQRWAPVAHFAKFGSEFKEGKDYIAGRMKRGQYTQAKVVARNRAKIVKKLQEDILSLQGLWQGQQAELAVQDQKIMDLQGEVALLENQLQEAIAHDSADVELLQDRLDRIKSIVLE